MGAKGTGTEKPLTAVQQVWLGHLERCEAQRCSSADYAREHGLSVRALYTARKELTQRGYFRSSRRSSPRTASQSVTLVPVPVEPPEADSALVIDCALRVVLPNGVIIEVPEGAAPARCQALAAALIGVAR